MHQLADDAAAVGVAETAVGPRQPSKARRRTSENFRPADTDDSQGLMKSSYDSGRQETGRRRPWIVIVDVQPQTAVRTAAPMNSARS